MTVIMAPSFRVQAEGFEPQSVVTCNDGYRDPQHADAVVYFEYFELEN